MSPFDPLFEAFLYVCGGGCCFFGSALFSSFFMRAVSERSAVSIRVLGNMCPLATDTSSGVLYPRACRAGPGPIESNISVGFTSGHLPHSWTCVRARSRSSGSSTRLRAVIHLCQGQGVARAARSSASRGRASSDGRAALSGLCGPVVVPGPSEVRPNPGWALSSIRSSDLKL